MDSAALQSLSQSLADDVAGNLEYLRQILQTKVREQDVVINERFLQLAIIAQQGIIIGNQYRRLKNKDGKLNEAQNVDAHVPAMFGHYQHFHKAGNDHLEEDDVYDTIIKTLQQVAAEARQAGVLQPNILPIAFEWRKRKAVTCGHISRLKKDYEENYGDADYRKTDVYENLQELLQSQPERFAGDKILFLGCSHSYMGGKRDKIHRGDIAMAYRMMNHLVRYMAIDRPESVVKAFTEDPEWDLDVETKIRDCAFGFESFDGEYVTRPILESPRDITRDTVVVAINPIFPARQFLAQLMLGATVDDTTGETLGYFRTPKVLICATINFDDTDFHWTPKTEDPNAPIVSNTFRRWEPHHLTTNRSFEPWDDLTMYIRPADS
ncbi:hypothetical protein BDV96DRAFT_652586 [Lophiotrema nucula]|uniref:Uncharacterized protein n=1 Tax=Lophiotrema nucula TaxID=690887 RepID=A0A6A5YNE9_9PLEO|nr:hypothetical protein BDV96DRAFT_652586 [Lophiotrema nucula]